MTQGQAGGKTWAGEQGGLLGTSRATVELGITGDTRWPWPQHRPGAAQRPWGLVLPPSTMTGNAGQAMGWASGGCRGTLESQGWRGDGDQHLLNLEPAQEKKKE